MTAGTQTAVARAPVVLTNQPPRRVLHVVGAMNRGGVETWLMHVLRAIDPARVRIDFLVHDRAAGVYDDEIRARGAAVISGPAPSRPWSYGARVCDVLRAHGPYDVVHSHVHHFSGFILKIAHQMRVPVRIAHSHNDTATLQRDAHAPRRAYHALMHRWIGRHATLGLAASGRAAAALFGPDWQSDPRWRVFLYAIDLTPFHATVDPAAVRADLGLPADAFVVGHVGRFHPQKNHRLLVAVAAELARREAATRLVLVGDGPLHAAVRRDVVARGLEATVVFAGERNDVPRLMLGAFDAFLFPSLHEGLGLVLVEAQAAGLPCITSSVVPDEVETAPSLLRRLPLAAPPAAWADAVLAARDGARTRRRALALVERSRFNIAHGLRALEAAYGDATSAQAAGGAATRGAALETRP